MFRLPRLNTVFTCMATYALAFFSSPMYAAETNSLRAGAAKVNITPKDLTGLVSVWAKPFTGVHDPIFARAVVIENGVNSAVIVSLDLVEFGDTMALRQRIQRELAIPAQHIIIAATHDHNAPRGGPLTPGTSPAALLALTVSTGNINLHKAA